jgi:hypothetical protein
MARLEGPQGPEAKSEQAHSPIREGTLRGGLPMSQA